MALRVLAVSVCFAFAAAPLSTAEPEASAPGITKISQFSGKPVPRFESLKFSAVHAASAQASITGLRGNMSAKVCP